MGNSVGSVLCKDGHGGRALEHRAEMRRIAEETIRELVPQIAENTLMKPQKRLSVQLNTILKQLLQLQLIAVRKYLTVKNLNRLFPIEQ